jgi:hypothetical protein
MLFQIISSFTGPADGMDFAVKQAMVRGATVSARKFLVGEATSLDHRGWKSLPLSEKT